MKPKEVYLRVKDLLSPAAASRVAEEDVVLLCPACCGGLQYRGRVEAIDVSECPGCHLPVLTTGIPLNGAAQDVEEEEARKEVERELAAIEREKTTERTAPPGERTPPPGERTPPPVEKNTPEKTHSRRK